MGLFDAWGRTHPITIDNTEVDGSGSHTSFPVLITLDHLDSEVTDAGSNSALNGGGDIRFTSDAAGNTWLNLDIVSFVTNATPASQECEMWVKVPSISTSVDTTIYIWYNKAAESQPAVTATGGRNGAWSLAEVSILMEDATPVDHTGNHTLNITGTLTNISGPFGNANSFAGDDRVENTDASLRDILTTHNTTVSVISRRTTYTNDSATMAWEGLDDFAIYTMDNNLGNGVRIFWRDIGGNVININNESLANTWIFSSFTTRASNDHEAYTNGISVATISNSGSAGPFTTFRLGGFGADSQDWDGDIAQVIVWKTKRTSDWIATEVNNQNSPATFASPGTPSTPGGGGVTIPVFIQHYRNQGMM